MTKKEVVAELRRQLRSFIRGLPDKNYSRVQFATDGFSPAVDGASCETEYIHTAEFGVVEESEAKP